jgi:hypothetical protein
VNWNAELCKPIRKGLDEILDDIEQKSDALIAELPVFCNEELNRLLEAMDGKYCNLSASDYRKSYKSVGMDLPRQLKRTVENKARAAPMMFNSAQAAFRQAMK